MIPQETLNELVRLRDEVAELREELRRRDEAVNEPVVRLMDALALTVGEAKVIRALSCGLTLTRERLLQETDEGLEIRTIDSHVKRIRRKCRPSDGVIIESIYGVGYRLDKTSVPIVRAIMNGKKTVQRRRYFVGHNSVENVSIAP